MSFAARLTSDAFAVDAGGTVPVHIEIEHQSEISENYELSLEGLDAGWTAIPTPNLAMQPGETRTERLLLKPPRESESTAGTYPFVVKVRSLESGESKSLPAILELRAFHHVSVDLTPKKGVLGPFSRQTEFEVTAVNLGNSEQTLQLIATDTDDAIAFQFDQDKVTVGPGQQKSFALRASGTQRPWLANSRLYGFTLSARSVVAPAVGGTAQAQIEQRALIAPGAALILLVLGLLLASWIALFPKDPAVDSFVLDRYEAMVGEPVKIEWRTSSASDVVIRVDGEIFKESVEPMGFATFTPETARVFTISAVARRKNKTSATITKTLVVNERPAVPMPVIESFSISPTKANVGQTLVIKYRLNKAVTKATLAPLNLQLDPRLNEIEVVPNREGEIVYRLVAENSEGKFVEKSAKVTVTVGSKARIVLFRSDSGTKITEGSNFTISWQLSDAVRAEISDGNETVNVDSNAGQRDFYPTQTTRYVLTAYDADGRTVTQELKVQVEKAEEPPTLDPVPDPTDAAPPTTPN